jgi:hypothetical protein
MSRRGIRGSLSKFLAPDRDAVEAASVAGGKFVCNSFMKASQRKNCGRKAKVDVRQGSIDNS